MAEAKAGVAAEMRKWSLELYSHTVQHAAWLVRHTGLKTYCRSSLL